MKTNLKTLVILLTLCISHVTYAQKELFIPAEWKQQRTDTLLYSETDTQNKYTWSKTRSKESENFICYWDKYYTTEPTKLGSANTYYVNVDDLLKKAESFYEMNVKKIQFCNEQFSKVSKYKMMILLNHTTDWVCYGGGYDFTIGALWLSPSTCKPVGHSVAHEVGHSFQYMCYSDYGGHSGFHDAIGIGSTFWEQTAQWQAAQSYPELKFEQSWDVFRKSHNYAMTHEWHRYQSYWWHYYLAEKYGIDIIGKIWRYQSQTASDANEVFMSLMNYDANQLYKEYFDYAMKMATLDLDVCRDEADKYIGTYSYDYVCLGGTKYQVAYSSCPQSSGFNIIPLEVPAPGVKVTTEFTSLPANAPICEGDPIEYLNGETRYQHLDASIYNKTPYYKNRGFRLGYVALLNDGTRVYSSEDEVYCKGSRASSSYSCTTEFVVPENVKRLFLVVVPAPVQYYQHKWNDNVEDDDQWPYTVEFSNTSIFGCPTISPDIPISDATIEYDVYFPASSGAYDGTTVKVEGKAFAVLGTAFQMQSVDIKKCMEEWSSTAPSDGKAKFYAVNSNGNLVNAGSTANGYGHWFTSAGNRVAWGSTSYLYSEFDPSSLTFNIGQYPGRLTNGKDYTISQAIKYRKGDADATVTFVFNVHVTANKSGFELLLAKVNSSVTDITGVRFGNKGYGMTYDMTGKVINREPASISSDTPKKVVYGREIVIKR